MFPGFGTVEVASEGVVGPVIFDDDLNGRVVGPLLHSADAPLSLRPAKLDSPLKAEETGQEVFGRFQHSVLGLKLVSSEHGMKHAALAGRLTVVRTMILLFGL